MEDVVRPAQMPPALNYTAVLWPASMSTTAHSRSSMSACTPTSRRTHYSVVPRPHVGGRPARRNARHRRRRREVQLPTVRYGRPGIDMLGVAKRTARRAGRPQRAGWSRPCLCKGLRTVKPGRHGLVPLRQTGFDRPGVKLETVQLGLGTPAKVKMAVPAARATAPRRPVRTRRDLHRIGLRHPLRRGGRAGVRAPTLAMSHRDEAIEANRRAPPSSIASRAATSSSSTNGQARRAGDIAQQIMEDGERRQGALRRFGLFPGSPDRSLGPSCQRQGCA